MGKGLDDKGEEEDKEEEECGWYTERKERPCKTKICMKSLSLSFILPVQLITALLLQEEMATNTRTIFLYSLEGKVGKSIYIQLVCLFISIFGRY